VDPFVVYNPSIGRGEYSSMKESLNDAMKRVERLSKLPKVIGVVHAFSITVMCFLGITMLLQKFDFRQSAIFLLATYQTVTLSYSNTRSRVDDEVGSPLIEVL